MRRPNPFIGGNDRLAFTLRALLGSQIIAEVEQYARCFFRFVRRLIFNIPQYNTLYMFSRHLYDSCDERVILRGVNKMAVWDPNDPSCLNIFPEIKKTGANVVRLVWLTEASQDPRATLTNLDHLLQNCLANQMIPMIELHDATMAEPTSDWSKLPTLVDYWTRPAVVTILNKYKRYLLLNIGNEVGDDQVTDAQFRAGYATAIQRIRSAGIEVPLVIDAAAWGQEFSYIRNNAAYLMNSDALAHPKKRPNLIFSLHIWWHYHTNPLLELGQVIQDVVVNNIPFIIGEFAGVCQQCDTNNNDAPYSEILSLCHQYSIGWIAWEWGPGNIGCADMDMTTNGQFATLRTGWPRSVALDHPYSISHTAETPYRLHNGKCECS